MSAARGAGPGPLSPTPDDGRRLSDAAAWDETTRPHGTSTAASGAAPSRRGLAAAQSLLDVHHELRGHLTQVRALVAEVAADPTTAATARAVLNQMAVRARTWATGATCAAYCNLVAQHHVGEDVKIFPYLRSRDTGLAPVLDRLETEHVVIHELLDAIDGALIAVVGGAPDGLEALTSVVDRLTDALLSHLAYEELELLGPMATAFG